MGAVQKWKSDIDNKVFLPDGSKIPVVLLANKCDMAKEGLVKNGAAMDKYCEEKGFAGWFETSAKENVNIDLAAQELVKKILEHEPSALEKNDTIDLDEDKPKSSGCCLI